MQHQSSGEISDHCNPCSSNFDPVVALQTDINIIPGLQDVVPLANITEYEEYQADPETFKKSQAEKKEKEEIKKAAKLKSAMSVQPVHPVQQRIVKNVLTRMDSIYGPTSCLKKWMQNRVRVKVITRSYRGIRGTCTGFIEAFDKYLNLAMVDVDEVYSSSWPASDKPPKKRGQKHGNYKPREQIADDSDRSGHHRAGDPEMDLLVKRVESLKLTVCNNIKRRHINQLFIRGDNVVSVSSCM